MDGSNVPPNRRLWLPGTKNPHIGIVAWEFRLEFQQLAGITAENHCFFGIA